MSGAKHLRDGYGFEDGEPVPVCPQQSEAEGLLHELECARDRNAKLEILDEVLARERESKRDWPELLRILIVLCPDPEIMFRSVHLLAFPEIPEAGKTQIELAVNLNVSETQVRRLLEQHRRAFLPMFIDEMHRLTAEKADNAPIGRKTMI